MIGVSAAHTPTPRMIEAGHPEATCELCGGPNIVWYAPSEVWNEVTDALGSSGAPASIWCPECFVFFAAAYGWKVVCFAAEVRRDEPSQEWLDAQSDPEHPLYGKSWGEARAHSPGFNTER
jgi:hypothetical protein